MSDSTPLPREPKHHTYETLNKLLEANRRHQSNRRHNRSFDIKLKVVEVSKQKGLLGDSTATINFIANEGVFLANEQTYDITGSLKIEDLRFTLIVEAAKPSETKISSVGTDNLSSQLVDPSTVKPLITINALLENRIGQSFFAQLLNISSGEDKVLAVLADSTGRVDAEIELNKKYITKDVLSSLTEKQTYLCSDIVLHFTEAKQLILKFNRRSNITPVKNAIPTLGSLNLSADVYSEEQQQKLSAVLKIKEKSDKPVAKREPKKKSSSPQKQEQTRVRKEPRVRNNPLPPHELVTIDKLEPWNNNQSFIGKILSLNVVESKEYKNLITFQGQVGDSTGVVDFEFAKKNDLVFNVNDIVKFEKVMNKGKDGKHFIEIQRFGSYSVVNDVTIANVNTANNLSTKELPTRPEKPASTKPIQSEGFVKINQLVLNNNKQSTIGKVLSVTEETRTTARGQNLQHLVGQIADETGAVDFDIIKQGDSSFKVGDTVELTHVINRAVSGKHVVVVLHLGKYTINSTNQLKSVNTNVIHLAHKSHNARNNQAKESNNNNQTQGNHLQANSGSRRQNNRSTSAQEGHSQRRRENSNNNANSRQSNRTNGDGQRRQYNNENKNESNTQNNNRRQRTQGGSGEAIYKPRNHSENIQANHTRSGRDQNNHENNNERKRAPLEYSKIKSLRPGSNGQNFVGKVFELKEITRELQGKSVTFLVGRVGDDSANIAFDFALKGKNDIHNNNVVVFKNIMNKVDDNGYHFITIGKFGHANLARHTDIGIVNTSNGESNLSSFEYIKKTISA